MKPFRQTLLGLLAILGTAAVFSACGKIAVPAINVPLSASGLSFVIPIAPSGSDSANFNYSVNLDSLVSATNTSLSTSSITSITIDTVDLVITSGATTPGNDFNNITSAYLNFTSTATPNSITTIVPLFTVPANSGTSLSLPVNSTINLNSYIAAGNVDTYFTFNLHAALATAITTPLNCRATVHFTVVANL